LTFLRDKRAEATAFSSESRSTSASLPSAPGPGGTDHDTNTSGTFADVNLEARRPDRPVPPMAGTAAVGAVVDLLATAIEEGRDLSSMSGILAGSSYRVLVA
jgi:hypothetical protein